MIQQGRSLIWIFGSEARVLSIAGRLTAEHQKQSLWVGSSAPDTIDQILAKQFQTKLGTEVDCLVFDAFSGFNPDALSALSGCIRGGGQLLLLSPNAQSWPGLADPYLSHIFSYPYSATEGFNLFIPRFITYLQQDWIYKIDADNHNASSLSSPYSCSISESPYWQINNKQQQAIEAIKRVAQGRSKRPLLLLSDRGRGKSTCLGLAAAQLMQSGAQHIAVCAPRFDNAAQVFQQAARVLPDFKLKQQSLSRAGKELVFYSVDHLLMEKNQRIDLLLMDEAANIPLPLLEKVLLKFNRIVFATTEHGYEGTGKGFSIKFKQLLDQHRPQWRRAYLNEPVRWAANDPLEKLIFDAFLLDAEPEPLTDLPDELTHSLRFSHISSRQLYQNTRLLKQVFSLLVVAHYQTRPSDLRMLLDSPNLSLFVAKINEQVVAVLISIQEGGLDTDLKQAISYGQRRLQGHLLPQALSAHLGYADSIQMKFSRIMRIAVLPQLQNQAIGSALVGYFIDKQKDSDFIASSFAVTANTLRFWHKNGLQAVHLGLKADHSSGTCSLMMLKPLNPKAQALHTQLHSDFVNALPFWLAHQLNWLDTETAVALLLRKTNTNRLSAKDYADIKAIAYGHRGFDHSMPLLRKLCLYLCHTGLFNKELWGLFQFAVQAYPLSTVSGKPNQHGKAQIEQHFRHALGNLLEQLKILHASGGD